MVDVQCQQVGLCEDCEGGEWLGREGGESIYWLCSAADQQQRDEKILMQGVELNRQKFPDFKKSTLNKTF